MDEKDQTLGNRRIWLAALVLALIGLGAWLFVSFFQAFLVLFAGALIGIFLSHLTAQIARLAGLRYVTAYGIVIVTLLILAGGAMLFMGQQIADQVSQLIDQLNLATSEVGAKLQLQDWRKRLSQFGGQGQASVASEAVSTATVAAWTTISVIGGAVLILFLGFYFALQPDRYRHGFVVLFQPEARPQVNDVLDKIGTRLWRWFLGRLVGMTVIGVGSAIGLWVMGVPLPVTLGALAGLMNFIPNIGPLIAAVPAVLLGLQQGTNTALYVLAFYFVLQFIESYLLTPIIDEHQVSIPPGLVLSSQLLFGVAAGFLGVALATPLTVVVIILTRELYVKR